MSTDLKPSNFDPEPESGLRAFEPDHTGDADPRKLDANPTWAERRARLSFSRFLRAQRLRNDAVGSVARDLLEDLESPGSALGLLPYLVESGATGSVISTAKAMLVEFSKWRRGRIETEIADLAGRGRTDRADKLRSELHANASAFSDLLGAHRYL